jgi:GNAT superfamily N-acetyltransferase
VITKGENAAMQIEIQKLMPEHAEAYARFFEETPHSEKPNEKEFTCYCVWWCNDDHDVNNIEHLMKRELRREYAIQKIREGRLKGYLAFYNGKVVGWCNANAKADCLTCYCWRRFMGEVPVEEPGSVRVKSVFCFLIAPEFRRKGVAKLLLNRVCEDAKTDGFDVVEAYPMKEYVNEAVDFMGPAGLFFESGFTLRGETQDRLVVRKPLHT